MNTIKKLTGATKASEIKRGWQLFDVKDKVLGRITTDIAQALMGKSKSYYTKTLDCGDFVVVVNAKSVAVTGKKETDKVYGNFSGFPGGLKEKALWQIRKEQPTLLITHAVKGMLPKNKLRDRLMTRLYVYADETHPYLEKFEGKQ